MSGSGSTDLVPEDALSDLVNYIIRPPRSEYSPRELGPSAFTLKSHLVHRTDFEITNSRDLTLQCSLYEPQSTPSATLRDPHAPGEALPYVIYLHGNGSCRLEAETVAKLVLPYGIGVLAFDMSGSGLSQGEYISLGVYEKLDVQLAVEYLRAHCRASKIALWGHSMGAATALMFAGMNKGSTDVAVVIADSPYASFDKLAETLVASMGLPGAIPRRMVLSVGVRYIKKHVRERAGFSLDEVSPVSAVKKCTRVPAVYVHGTADEVVTVAHSELLCKAHASPDKQHVVIEGGTHESPRPMWVLEQCMVKLLEHLFDSWAAFYAATKARANDVLLEARYEDAVILYSALVKRGEVELRSATGAADHRRHRQSVPVGLERSSSTGGGIAVPRGRARSRSHRRSSSYSREDDSSADEAGTAVGAFFKRVFGPRKGMANQTAAKSAMPRTKSRSRSPRGRPGSTSISGEQTAPVRGGLFNRTKSSRNSLKPAETKAFSSSKPRDDAHTTSAPSSTNPVVEPTTTAISGSESTAPAPRPASVMFAEGTRDNAETEAARIRAMLVPIYGNRALAHIKLNKFEDAVNDAQRSIDLDSTGARAYQRKAQALLGLKQYDQALECIVLGLSHDASNQPLLDLKRQVEREKAQQG